LQSFLHEHIRRLLLLLLSALEQQMLAPVQQTQVRERLQQLQHL
jgi:hypothetical protein